MTREEAIERIEHHKSSAKFFVKYSYNEHDAETEWKDIEAFDMAIEALKGGDAEMNETKSPYMQQSPDNGADLSAEAEWIPFSEGLPEEHEWIGTKKFGTTISDKVHITFDVNGERFVRTLSLQNGELSNYEKRTMDTLHKGWKMIAWMPLPKPYKGGDTE